MAHYRNYTVSTTPEKASKTEIKRIEKKYEEVRNDFKRLDSDFPDFFDNNEMQEKYQELIEEAADIIKFIEREIDKAKGDIR